MDFKQKARNIKMVLFLECLMTEIRDILPHVSPHFLAPCIPVNALKLLSNCSKIVFRK